MLFSRASRGHPRGGAASGGVKVLPVRFTLTRERNEILTLRQIAFDVTALRNGGQSVSRGVPSKSRRLTIVARLAATHELITHPDQSISSLSLSQVRGGLPADLAARPRQSSTGHCETGRLPGAVSGAQVRAVLQLQHRRYGDERHDAEQQGHRHQSLRYTHTRARVYIYIYIYIYIYVYVYRTLECTHIHTHVSIHMHTCARARVQPPRFHANSGAPIYVPATKHSP